MCLPICRIIPHCGSPNSCRGIASRRRSPPRRDPAPHHARAYPWSTPDAYFDNRGQRKYLVRSERIAFIKAASRIGGPTETFCLTLAFTGARISEVLALTPEHIDEIGGCLIFETLKRRARGVYRTVPVPPELFERLDACHNFRNAKDAGEDHTARLWPWSRPTAWKRVKEVMSLAGVSGSAAKPKGLRHTFGVGAVQNRIALSLIQKWLGHARIDTTALYATPIGDEERALAKLMWDDLLRATRSKRVHPILTAKALKTSRIRQSAA